MMLSGCGCCPAPFSGSDGLVKVWTVRTGECVATLDAHTERIWALTTSRDGEVLASGGGDSLICFWKVRFELLNCSN